MYLSDFRDIAATLRGSRDVGAQLFCALLRSVGVDARLVCSLQLLPFRPAQKMTMSRVRRRIHKVPDQASRQATPYMESDSDVNSEGSGSANQDIGANKVNGEEVSMRPRNYSLTASVPFGARSGYYCIFL